MRRQRKIFGKGLSSISKLCSRIKDLGDAGNFQKYVIKNSETIFKKSEMEDTLYFVRMWFGSDLNKLEWMILAEDVRINSSTAISLRLPF